jgi:ABC-type microcin C transport system permease subunit YejB
VSCSKLASLQGDQSVNRAHGLLCVSWMGLYWPICLIWGLSLSWLLRYNFRGCLLTWLWMVSIPVCSCNVSMGVTRGSLVLIVNNLFLEKLEFIYVCFGRITPRKGGGGGAGIAQSV